MPNSSKETVEIIEQIEYKLRKYLNLKNAEKIKEYLNHLDQLSGVTKDALKATRIVECLKEIKKQNNPDYSKNSADLIAKWKTQLSADEPVKSVSPPPVEAKQPPKISISDYKVKKGSDMMTTAISSSETRQVSKQTVPTTKMMTRQNSAATSSSSIMPLPSMPLTNIIDPNELYNSNHPSKPELKSSSYSSSSYIKSNQPVPKATNRMLSDDEALTKIFSSRYNKQRTLYSGRKNVDTHVPKLFELCTRTLVDNIDDFPVRIYEYNMSKQFAIPFDPIKTVIEKTNAKQLELVEYYSPNLADYTDYIWEKICLGEFKNLKLPQEKIEEIRGEWREFYQQKKEEREQRFQEVRQKLSVQQNTTQKRQTQLATVNFAAKKSIPSFGARTSIKTQTAHVPTRAAIIDGPRPNGFKKPAALVPAKSQGMKATLKLLKRPRR